MSYYSGILEHDTGIHADAEQTVAGQQMLTITITLAEYRKLVEDHSKSNYIIDKKDVEIREYKQKLYDALNAIVHNSPMNDTQKEDFRKLCADWQVKKE